MSTLKVYVRDENHAIVDKTTEYFTVDVSAKYDSTSKDVVVTADAKYYNDKSFAASSGVMAICIIGNDFENCLFPYIRR